MTSKFDPSDPALARGLKKIAELRAQGRLRDAAWLGDSLLQSRPPTKHLLNLAGTLRLELGDWRAAAECLRQSLELEPRQPLTAARLGNALLELGQAQQALSAHLRALRLDPNLVDARVGKAKALAQADRTDEALAALREAAMLRPESPEIPFENAKLLRRLGRFDEADAAFGEALRLRPRFASALVLRSLLMAERGHIEAAITYARAGVEAAPGAANPRAVLGEVLLLAGRYMDAWDLCESRRELGPKRGRNPAYEKIPQWDGKEPIAGKSVVIQPDVGLGDFVMFARYIPIVRECGGNPVVLAPAALARLLRSLDGAPEIIPTTSPWPDVDYRCPVMSLGRAFRTTLESIPSRFPYLHADARKVDEWRRRLGPRTRPRVGIAWSGKDTRGIDRILQRRRTIDPAALAPVWALPLEFHSLQKEYVAADGAWLSQQGCVRDHSGALRDFTDTAALASNMDLVLSIDTSVTHVAGALALPLWVMLPFFSDYRWCPQLATSPWYPDARLFRQPAPGNWGAVAAGVAVALKERFAL